MTFEKGNTIWKGRKHSEESKRKMAEKQKGANNSVWKGGITKAAGGYITILCPEHPYCDVNRRVKQERLVMEEYLGRYLEWFEIVHHMDEIKDHNIIENLELCCRSSHARIHGNFRNKRHSPQTRERISLANKGRKHSTETIAKMRDGRRAGVNSSTYGRKWTEEERRRLSQSQLGRKDSEETKAKKAESAKKAWVERRQNVA